MINDEEEGLPPLEETPNHNEILLNIQISGGGAGKRQSIDSINKGGGKGKGKK